MRVTWDNVNWRALRRLRETFLAAESDAGDYWTSESDLAAYDLSFGARIGWKWDHVARELQRIDWMPPRGDILDWGCGTGRAGRVWAKHWGADSLTGVVLWDRSPLAIRMARQFWRDEFPSVPVKTGQTGTTVLLSHLITELSASQCNDLIQIISHATAIIWVEPGTKHASDRLLSIREQLRPVFHMIVPCPHDGPCGLRAPGNEQHWCHHLASSPPEVHCDANWARFARWAGVDLRRLPLSYLVLDKRPVAANREGWIRVLGEPRLYKGYARVLACDATGVQDRRLTQRSNVEVFRQIKKGAWSTLQQAMWVAD